MIILFDKEEFTKQGKMYTTMDQVKVYIFSFKKLLTLLNCECIIILSSTYILHSKEERQFIVPLFLCFFFITGL